MKITLPVKKDFGLEIVEILVSFVNNSSYNKGIEILSRPKF